MSKPQKFLTKTEEQEIIRAIKTAEKNTSGEIRVHIEPECKGALDDRVKQLFQQLEMHKTKERNGVLFYLAVNDHKFYILGDRGIHQKVTDNFWESTRDVMQKHFKKQAFKQGLIDGILMAGEQLKKYFPYQHDDLNELSDEISKN